MLRVTVSDARVAEGELSSVADWDWQAIVWPIEGPDEVFPGDRATFVASFDTTEEFLRAVVQE